MKWGEFRKKGDSYWGLIDYCGYTKNAIIEPGTSKRGHPFRVIVDDLEVGDANPTCYENLNLNVYLYPPEMFITTVFHLVKKPKSDVFEFVTIDR